MQFTQKIEYAVRGLTYLARKPKDEVVFVSEIAKEQGIPRDFLAKIFQKLAKHKILASKRGKEGGFIFKKKPKVISVYDIIKITEGEVAINKCLEEGSKCSAGSKCKMFKVWEKAQSQMTDVFKKTKLSHLIK